MTTIQAKIMIKKYNLFIFFLPRKQIYELYVYQFNLIEFSMLN